MDSLQTTGQYLQGLTPNTQFLASLECTWNLRVPRQDALDPHGGLGTLEDYIVELGLDVPEGMGITLEAWNRHNKHAIGELGLHGMIMSVRVGHAQVGRCC